MRPLRRAACRIEQPFKGSASYRARRIGGAKLHLDWLTRPGTSRDWVHGTREERMVEREWVEARRALEPGVYGDRFATLAEADWDGEWVTPIQITSDDPTGPVIMGSHWLNLDNAQENRPAIERYGGYLPWLPFNRVLDLALWHTGLSRRDIYITQACHLLPRNGVTQAIPEALWSESYEAVTRNEIGERPLITLGGAGRRLCEHYRIRNARSLEHPSGRGRSHSARALEIAEALTWALRTAKPSARKR